MIYLIGGGITAILASLGWIGKSLWRIGNREAEIARLLKAEHMPPCPQSAEAMEAKWKEVKGIIEHNCKRNESLHKESASERRELFTLIRQISVDVAEIKGKLYA